MSEKRAEARQRVFDTAYRGLRRQGWEQSLSDDSFGCAYRGQHGRKCAIGHCIPDAVYDPKIEGLPADDEIVMQLNTDLARCGRLFLGDLQQAHDRARFHGEIPYLLRKLAERYDLTIPEGDS